MPAGVEVTGLVEIEGNLIEFERVVAPAELRKATRTAAKIVQQQYVANAEESAVSGSMRDATVVRATKRSREQIGASVKIDRDKLFRLYESRTGAPPNPRKGDDEPFFYPAIVELGDPAENIEPQRPLRGALYDNETAVKKEFSDALLRAVNHPKIKMKSKR